MRNPTYRTPTRTIPKAQVNTNANVKQNSETKLLKEMYRFGFFCALLGAMIALITGWVGSANYELSQEKQKYEIILEENQIVVDSLASKAMMDEYLDYNSMDIGRNVISISTPE